MLGIFTIICGITFDLLVVVCFFGFLAVSGYDLVIKFVKRADSMIEAEKNRIDEVVNEVRK